MKKIDYDIVIAVILTYCLATTTAAFAIKTFECTKPWKSDIYESQGIMYISVEGPDSSFKQELSTVWECGVAY